MELNIQCAERLRTGRALAYQMLDRTDETPRVLAVFAAEHLLHGLDDVRKLRERNGYPPVDRPLKNQIRKTTQCLANLSKYALPLNAQRRSAC